jgi:hypothetical protein
MAEPTGLEPATSDVTGRRSNQLNYDSACKPEMSNRLSIIKSCPAARYSVCPKTARIYIPPIVNGRHGGIRTPNLFLVREAVYH